METAGIATRSLLILQKQAQATAASTQGGALTLAAGTIGSVSVAAMGAVTNARKTYESQSAANDQAYLDGVAVAEKAYLTVVANKSHEFRTGAITEETKNAAISAAWTTYQSTVTAKRHTYRHDQAADAATYRNAVAEAEKTRVNNVSAANETLTTTVENAEALLDQQKWDAWLTGSKALVNLNADSTIARATSLATALGGLASQNTSYDNNGVAILHPFWTALAEKVDLSAGHIADIKNAEREYYAGWTSTQIVNGQTVTLTTGGVLDARRNFAVNASRAKADLHIGTVTAAGVYQREVASAGSQLAHARSTYETDWAALNLESSGWSLGNPYLWLTSGAGGSTGSSTTGSSTSGGST